MKKLKKRRKLEIIITGVRPEDERALALVEVPLILLFI